MSLRNVLLGLFLGAMAVPVAFGEARSDTMPANSGKEYLSTQQTCFAQTSWTGIVNHCQPDKAAWVIALPNGFAAGTRSFRASSTHTAGSGRPVCTAIVASRMAGLIWAGNATTVGDDTSLGSTSTGVTDTFHVICDLTSTLDVGRAITSARVL